MQDWGLTPHARWRCRSVSRGWGWRCGERCWGRAGRQTGSPPAGRGSHTPRTPSCTRTGTWQRSTCCLLFEEAEQNGRIRNESPVHIQLHAFWSALHFPLAGCHITTEEKKKTSQKENISRISLGLHRYDRLQRNEGVDLNQWYLISPT